MMDRSERLRVKRTLRDEAFWIALLPLAASLHPEARAFLADRWELILVLLGYLAHNGYLRGKSIVGVTTVMEGDAISESLDDLMMTRVEDGDEQPRN